MISLITLDGFSTNFGEFANLDANHQDDLVLATRKAAAAASAGAPATKTKETNVNHVSPPQPRSASNSANDPVRENASRGNGPSAAPASGRLVLPKR
jgi:hypothetical protein